MSKVLAEIHSSGPMRVDRFMSLCLGHPDHGYYATRDPLGRDFTTAPEISQMFGELIGLWGAQVWSEMGRPDRMLWIELGPGRGTLTADALRAAKIAPGFAESLDVWFVETSPTLREAQARNVPSAKHVDRLDEAPRMPALLIANEFFDALPIRQFARVEGRWREKLILADEGGLKWGLGAPMDVQIGEAADGAIFELSPPGRANAEMIGRRLAMDGGAALIFDYGEMPRGPGGDTLQAIRSGRPDDPLAAPGEADLTAHVDFAALARALEEGGARLSGYSTQAAFLAALGIEARAAALVRARPARADEIMRALRRLTAQDEMGTLFKVLAAVAPNQPPAPGFSAGE